MAGAPGTTAPSSPGAPASSQANAAGYASSGSLTITGTATAGSTIKVYDGANLLGSVIADATTGAYSFAIGTTIAALATGTHSLTVTATNTIGTSAPSSPLAVIVDTTAPLVAITSGAVTTATAMQIITGTVTDAHPGTTVSIYDNLSGTALATAMVGTGGGWSTSVTLVGSGLHSLVAKTTDLAGNPGSSSAVVDMLVVTPPTPAAISIAQRNTSGYAPTGSLTITGTAEAGSRINIYDGSSLLGTITADAVTGAYNFPIGTAIAALIDGTHSLTVTATNLAGTSVPSPAIAVIVDTTAPLVAITSGAVTTTTANQTITGTVTDAHPGTTVSIYDNLSGTALATAIVGTDGAWSTSVTLVGSGPHSLVAKTTDLAGNPGSSSAVVDTLNVPPPMPAAMSIAQRNTSGYAPTGSLTITGAAEAGSTINIYDGSTLLGTVTADATTGAYSFSIGTAIAALSDGTHSLTVTATNTTGTSAPSSATIVIVDTTAPLVAITSGAVTTATAAQIITGTVTDAHLGTTVSIYDNLSDTALATAMVGTDGAWSTSVTLVGGGAHSLVAKTTDLAGNPGSSGAVVDTLNVPPPMPAAMSIAQRSTSGYAPTGSLTITGAAEAGSTINIYDGSTLLGTVTADATTGAYSFSIGTAISALSDGTHSLTVTATNTTGTSAPSSATTVIVDTTAPLVAITSGAVTTATAAQIITGTVTDAHPGTMVTLYDNLSDTALATAMVGADGAWSTSVTLVGGGPHSLVAKTTDLAGNPGSSSAVVDTLIVTPPTPAAPAITEENAAGYAKTGSLTVTGTATVGSTIKVYDGSNLLGTVTTDPATGDYSVIVGATAALSTGSHFLKVTAGNTAGTSDPSSATKVIVDTTLPIVTTTSPAVAYTTATQTITGTVADANPGTLTIYDTSNGSTTSLATATVAQDGTWSTSVTFVGNGTHSLVASDTDLAGNVGASISLVDTYTPVVVSKVLAISSAAVLTKTATQTISGTATGLTPGSLVSLYDNGTTTAFATAIVTANGLWSTSVLLVGEGSHSLVARSADDGVITSSLALLDVLDTIPPVLAITSPATQFSTATQTIYGTATDLNLGSIVSLYDNGTLDIIGTATVGANGTWSTQVGLADSWRHNLVAKDTDLAGNTGSSAVQTILAIPGTDPLVDSVYYLAANPDVAAAGMNASTHYQTYGTKEGRNPDALFTTVGYAGANPGVTAANALANFESTGWQQNHAPSANFDVRLYLLNNPDVVASGLDPLQHYLAFGQYEGRATYAAIGPQSPTLPGFDREYYELANPDVAKSGMDPLVHFETFGWKEGRAPDAVFDVKYYLAQNPDVAGSGLNPLLQYDNFGWKEGRDPSAAFSTSGYLAHNADVAAAGVNPLQHYLTNGIFEGRAPG